MQTDPDDRRYVGLTRRLRHQCKGKSLAELGELYVHWRDSQSPEREAYLTSLERIIKETTELERETSQ